MATKQEGKASISIAEYKALTEKAKPSKYRAQPTTVDGIRFDSKREAKVYSDLMNLKRAGEITYFLRQVPIHLPGGTRLVIDFLIFYPDRPPRYLDAKGVWTPAFKIKKREIEAAYPIEVETI
jgi:hypothetical protein